MCASVGWVIAGHGHGELLQRGSAGRRGGGGRRGGHRDGVVGADRSAIRNDFEDGTTQGWFPFGSPTVTNSTDVAYTGTHSLLTTGRTSGFMGPGTSLTGQLTAGAKYHVSVAARLAAGQAATGLSVTVMRSFADGTNAVRHGRGQHPRHR